MILGPEHLGFKEEYSEKGKSKNYAITEVVRGFLERPYDSKQNPIKTRDWKVIHCGLGMDRGWTGDSWTGDGQGMDRGGRWYLPC